METFPGAKVVSNTDRQGPQKCSTSQKCGLNLLGAQSARKIRQKLEPEIRKNARSLFKKSRKIYPKGGAREARAAPFGAFSLFFEQIPCIFADFWHKFLSNFPSKVFRALLRWPWHWPWPEKTTQKRQEKTHKKVALPTKWMAEN